MVARNLTTRIDRELQNARWDAFLLTTAGGHHAQSSAWAALKRSVHYRSVRILIEDRGQLLGGGQILITTLPLLGAVAYVPKGPVLAEPDHELLRYFMDRLDALLRELRVRCCIIQPAEDSLTADFPAADFGYSKSSITVGPTASVRVALDRGEAELLAAMKSQTRSGIRSGLRQGVIVRPGDRRDLDQFHELLKSTGARQQFAPEPRAYFDDWWDCFRPNVQLFFAEHHDRVLSAAFIIAFGRTIYYKRAAWSGNASRLHPNEVLHWEIIRWAKATGFLCYDLEGIDRRYAEQRLAGERGPTVPAHSVSRFKVGFGGRICLYPPAYERFYWRPMQWLRRLSGRSPYFHAILNLAKRLQHRPRIGTD